MTTFPGYPAPSTTPTEEPALGLQVTDEQRERATRWLQEAYADGRVDGADFERRLGLVIGATTRSDLNEAFAGVPSGSPSGPSTGHLTYPPAAPAATTGRGGAALAHFIALISSFVGPLIVYLASSHNTYVRKEAAKSFNFQIIALVVTIAAGIITSFLPHALDGFIMPLLWLGWLLGTIVGGARAASGDDWTNPVKKVIRIDILPEDGR